MKPDNDSQSDTMLCPYCREKINSGAKVCRHCGKKIPNKTRNTIFAILGFIVIIYYIFAPSDSSTSVSTTTPATKYALGQEMFLRLPNTSDPTQIICLAPTEDVYDEYTKALLAKDPQGILDLGSTGLFCVGNGTEVKIIDTSTFNARVRVVKGENKVDADKVGLSGWTDKTFLSN